MQAEINNSTIRNFTRRGFSEDGSQSELPEGWRWARLGEVCLSTEKRDPRTTPDLSFQYGVEFIPSL